ncbi:hypothetical protein B0H11DRAFT_1033948 [Mycena galericulata]|nr:hypothetical protein B0H11DRAFT_1033948 [Mycena galericulata]
MSRRPNTGEGSGGEIRTCECPMSAERTGLDALPGGSQAPTPIRLRPRRCAEKQARLSCLLLVQNPPPRSTQASVASSHPPLPRLDSVTHCAPSPALAPTSQRARLAWSGEWPADRLSSTASRRNPSGIDTTADPASSTRTASARGDGAGVGCASVGPMGETSSRQQRKPRPGSIDIRASHVPVVPCDTREPTPLSSTTRHTHHRRRELEQSKLVVRAPSLSRMWRSALA